MKVTGSVQKKKGYYYIVVRLPTKNGTQYEKKQKWFNTKLKATPRNKTAAQVILAEKLTEYGGIVYSDKMLLLTGLTNG